MGASVSSIQSNFEAFDHDTGKRYISVDDFVKDFEVQPEKIGTTLKINRKPSQNKKDNESETGFERINYRSLDLS